ncbi:MAG TPA: DUF4235 domain-containing protein [Dermatophilaceae bacterium]|nr:DUF4235 domain-containing protein [Dermatophilaceae bacterium]
MGDATWKIIGTGSAVLAGLAATKAADKVWEKAAGDKPGDPKNPEQPLRHALAYAAVTGLAVGVARTLATRKAAQYYAKSSGRLPEEIQDSSI